MFVALTVPHAHCLSPATNPQRHCDRTAAFASHLLSLELKRRGVKTVEFVTDQLRSFCDMNRTYCSDTQYRQGIRKWVNHNRDNIIITLDMHSFPGQLKSWGEYDIIILDDPATQDRAFFTDYAMSLYNYIQTKGIHIQLWQGKGNSIQDEMRAAGIRNLLLEFNESLDYHNLSRITKVVGDWLLGQSGNKSDSLQQS